MLLGSTAETAAAAESSWEAAELLAALSLPSAAASLSSSPVPAATLASPGLIPFTSPVGPPGLSGDASRLHLLQQLPSHLGEDEL